MSNENLQKMFVEDAPQQVNELENVRSLSNYVIDLQKLEEEKPLLKELLHLAKNQGLMQLIYYNKKLNWPAWLRKNKSLFKLKMPPDHLQTSLKESL